MADFHVKAHSSCNASDPDLKPKKVLQIMWSIGGTCAVEFKDASFRHLHPDLIDQSVTYDKVTLVHPTTGQKKILKDNGQSIEPVYETSD